MARPIPPLVGTALVVCCLVSAAAREPGPPIDLSAARVQATHDSGAPPSISMAFDGDAETCWAGDGHDLTKMATNLIVDLAEPTVVGGVEFTTAVVKECLRLTAVEVYCEVGEGWALLGAVADNDRTTFALDLTPSRVTRLRVRVLDTARPDHAWPRIYEMRLFAPSHGTEPVAPVPDEVRGETLGERYYLDGLPGRTPAVESTVYDPERGYLGYARSCVDTLIAHGTDVYGAVRSPLFASILDCATLRHPGAPLPPIAGQRQHDRAAMGGNLNHDVMLLEACRSLSLLTGDDRYEEAAESYLSWFLANCTRTETGLWPWGEHAHWDFYEEAPGHTTHEYLGAAPVSFWQRAWELSPEAVLGEGRGLLNHVVNLETFDYNRHADITGPLPVPRPPRGDFLDFPRHGGFYLQVWAFCYSKTGDRAFADWCDRMMDHHVAVRHPRSGLLPSVSSTPGRPCGVATQLSLAVSMLQSVPLLGQTDTALRCDRLAREYLAAVAALPHDLEGGAYCSGCPLPGPAPEPRLSTPGFEADYGGEFLARDATLWCLAYRLTGEPRYLAIARSLATFYAGVETVPSQGNTRAVIYSALIELMLDMAELTGEGIWLPAAERFAAQAIERLYCNGLFRGATGLWYYESELWAGSLVHALVRLAAELDARGPEVAPNYFHR